jgi:hypothetical protein
MKTVRLNIYKHSKTWYLEEHHLGFIQHRDCGPSFISDNILHWMKNGCLHREDGPAVVHKNGTNVWFKYGIRKRDGV